MRVDERLPRVAGAAIAVALLTAYLTNPWPPGPWTVVVVGLSAVGTGEYVSYRLRRSDRQRSS
jgi:hypothetical protein